VSNRFTVPDRAAVPALLFGGFALVNALILLVRTQFDPSRLVHASPPLTDAAAALPSLTVLPAGLGFDGQFYYRLSISPFSAAIRLGGVTFDVPSLRGSRVGFGIVGFLLSGGQPALVPIALLVANVLLFAVLGLLAGLLMRQAGRHAGWAALLLIWPGFAYSLALDTAEILAAVCVVGGLLALRRAHWGWAALALSGAVITRESTVTIVAALWVTTTIQLVAGRRHRRERSTIGTLLASSAAGIAFVLVQLYGYLQFGEIPLLSSGQSNLGIPFEGVLGAIQRSFPPVTPGKILDFSAVLLVLVVLGCGLAALRYSAAATAEKVAWATTALMMVSITGPWISAPSSMRAAVELIVMTIVVVLGVPTDRIPPRSGLIAAGYQFAVWVLTAGTMLVKAPNPH
jgi:hypothetical protein